MPMSPRLLRPRTGGFHPEASDWRSRVIANGGTVSGSTLTAVSNFCRSIDGAGLRSLLWRVSPMAGDNLSAALVPLYRSNVALGVQGNATDTNSNFVSGDYDAASGLLGNGSNKALSTGLSAGFRNGRHIGFVAHSLATVAFRYYMGARNGGSPANGGLFAIYPADSNSTLTGVYTYSDVSNVGNAYNGTAVVRRLYLANNASGAVGANMYADGTATGVSGSGQDSTLTAAIGIFAAGQIAGTFSSHVNARLSGYTIGENMTASQVASYNTIWTALLTALGRA